MQIVLADNRCLYIELGEVVAVINDDSRMEMELFLGSGQTVLAKNGRLADVLEAISIIDIEP